jgi:DNA polymerase-3 subunit delta
MLQEYLGNNLEKIANELGKLYINIPKSKQITEELIEQFIGISKDYNVTELQKAIAYKNSFKAYQIVQYFADNPKDNPIFKTIPILLSFFTKTILLHSHGKISDDDIKKTLGLGYYGVQDYKAAARNYSPDKLMSIVSWLREANTKAIGIDNHSIEHGELLKELIFKILH